MVIERSFWRLMILMVEEGKEVKDMTIKDGSWMNLFEDPKYVYCGDISVTLDSRVLPLFIWLALCFLPFLLLTVLHNLANLAFLRKHLDILFFANISHFQIGPRPNQYCNDSGDGVK